MFKYKIKNYNLTTWLLLIKSYLIISAICGGNSQHTKAGDCSEFYNFTVLNLLNRQKPSNFLNFTTWLYCTVLAPNMFHVYSMYIAHKICLCEFKKIPSMERDRERKSIDHKKHQKYKTIYIQFNLIINPLNIKIFTI